MNTFLYDNRKRMFSALLIFFCVACVIAIYFLFIVFRVVSVSPDTNKTYSPSTQAIQVKFNKPLKGKTVRVSATNNLQTTNSISGDTVTINIPYGLNFNSTYTVTIDTVTANDGAVLKNIKLIFKTNNDPSLSSDQLKIALLNQENSRPSAYNDPVYKALPYTDPNGQYVIQPHIESGIGPNQDSRVSIEVIVYLTSAQEGDNRQDAIGSIESAALAHLKTIPNVDLNNYDIYYTIQDPLT